MIVCKYGTGGNSSISAWHSKLFIYFNILIKKCQRSVILKRIFLNHAHVCLESIQMLCSTHSVALIWLSFVSF